MNVRRTEHWHQGNTAVDGSAASKSFLLCNCAARETFKEHLNAWISILLAFCVITFTCCIGFLQDGLKQWITVELTKAIYQCDPRAEVNVKCVSDWQSLSDYFEMVASTVVGICSFAFPLDLMIFVFLNMRQYRHGAWYAWILFHYIVGMMLAFTLFLSPVGFGLYKLARSMKMYGLTFESRVPFK